MSESEEKEAVLRGDLIEPIAMRAGDSRVRVNGQMIPRDFRIISEGQYQALYAIYLIHMAANRGNHA